MLVYVPHYEPSFQEALERLKLAGFRLIIGRAPTRRERQQVTVLFCTVQLRISATVINEYPKLETILTASNGTDHIDKGLCEGLGIRVISARAANANAVAELVIGLLIGISRGIFTHHSQLMNGHWRAAPLGKEMKEITLGLIGCGAIGQLVALKARLLDIQNVIGYDPYVSRESCSTAGIVKQSKQSVLCQADVVSLHLPLLPSTQHFMSAEEFQLMKPESYLINTSRGEIVDEQALLMALDNKIIAGAALDVFSTEPTPPPALITHPAIVATPHIGAFTASARTAMALAPVEVFLKDFQATTNIRQQNQHQGL